MSEYIGRRENKTNISPQLNPNDKMFAVLAHISPILGFGLIGSLVVWLAKKNVSPFIDDQAKEALNFHISVAIVSIICLVSIVGWLLLPVIPVGVIVFSAIAATEANKGVEYRYPYNFRFIK